MRIWLDTEFLEQGPTVPIELISIGMVREDGKKLYLINADFDPNKFLDHPWLNANVRPHLPIYEFVNELYWDLTDPIVVPKRTITESVQEFVLEIEKPELWAYYSHYDHVVLCQLFGTMKQLPSGFPMFTNDLNQLARHYNIQLLEQKSNHHHALADTLWCRDAHLYLESQL